MDGYPVGSGNCCGAVDRLSRRVRHRGPLVLRGRRASAAANCRVGRHRAGRDPLVWLQGRLALPAAGERSLCRAHAGRGRAGSAGQSGRPGRFASRGPFAGRRSPPGTRKTSRHGPDRRRRRILGRSPRPVAGIVRPVGRCSDRLYLRGGLAEADRPVNRAGNVADLDGECGNAD